MRHLSAILLLLASTASAQSVFQRVFDCDQGEVQAIAATTTDATYVAYYLIEDSILGSGSGVGLVKYDAAFNAEWNRVYSMPTDEVNLLVASLAPTADGGVVLGGYKRETVSDTATVMKVNASGTVLWSLSLPSPLPPGAVDDSNCDVTMVKVAANGDVLVVGRYSYYTDDYYTRAFVSRITDGGTVLWTRSLVGVNDPEKSNKATDVLPLSGGGVVVFGTTDGNSEGSWLARLQDNGTLDWVKRYNTSTAAGFVLPVRVFQTAAGFDLFMRHSDFGQNILSVIHTDASGSSVGADVYTVNTGSCAAIDATRLPDGSTTVAGYGVLPLGGGVQVDAVMLRLDAAGQPQWSAAIGTDENESARTIAPTDDGGFLFGGAAAYFDLAGHRGGTPSRPFLVKTDGAGTYTCGQPLITTVNDTTITSSTYTLISEDQTGWVIEPIITQDWLISVTVCPETGIDDVQTSPFTVAPNPAADFFTITSTVQGRATHELVDASGRIVRTVIAVTGTVQLPVEDLLPGVYILRSHDQRTVYCTPVMVVR